MTEPMIVDQTIACDFCNNRIKVKEYIKHLYEKHYVEIAANPLTIKGFAWDLLFFTLGILTGVTVYGLVVL